MNHFAPVILAATIALGGCAWLKERAGWDVSLPAPSSPAQAVYMARGQYVAILEGVNAACPEVTTSGPCTQRNLAFVDGLAINADRILDKAEPIVRNPVTANTPEAEAVAAEATAAVRKLNDAAPN